jgi:hypothetical protein
MLKGAFDFEKRPVRNGEAQLLEQFPANDGVGDTRPKRKYFQDTIK